MSPQPEPSTQEVLAGLVERITYHNAENGFCVLRARARGHRDVVTVVGHVATISAGEWITASGEWGWIPSLLWPPRPWRLSSRRLPEPFPWPGLRRPSAVSDRSRRLEASSPVRSFPSPHSPPSSGKGLAGSIQGQSEQSLKTLRREPISQTRDGLSAEHAPAGSSRHRQKIAAIPASASILPRSWH
jgi:hypothetical protein